MSQPFPFSTIIFVDRKRIFLGFCASKLGDPFSWQRIPVVRDFGFSSFHTSFDDFSYSQCTYYSGSPQSPSDFSGSGCLQRLFSSFRIAPFSTSRKVQPTKRCRANSPIPALSPNTESDVRFTLSFRSTIGIVMTKSKSSQEITAKIPWKLKHSWLESWFMDQPRNGLLECLRASGFWRQISAAILRIDFSVLSYIQILFLNAKSVS